MRDVIVIGGGCWGYHHVSRLLRARDTGLTQFRHLLVVDHALETRVKDELGTHPDVRHIHAEWDQFLRGFIEDADDEADGTSGDHIIPAPLAPHLFQHWLLHALTVQLAPRTVRSEPVRHTFEQPFVKLGQDGALYFSFADWLCPAACTEPERCPATRGPRTWEQSRFLRAQAQAWPDVSALIVLVCEQIALGVASVSVRQLRAEREQVLTLARARQTPLTILIATVSACHGAMGQIEIQAPLA
jgi:hypothetical protein